MKIQILPGAERDLEVGADFYESQSPGLGLYFTECLMTDIDSLRLYAGMHAKQHERYRCISKRFPFAIYDDLTANTIEVYAVLDCRQDPAKIERRLG